MGDVDSGTAAAQVKPAVVLIATIGNRLSHRHRLPGSRLVDAAQW